jgi:hypothetical protein
METKTFSVYRCGLKKMRYDSVNLTTLDICNKLILIIFAIYCNENNETISYYNEYVIVISQY